MARKGEEAMSKSVEVLKIWNPATQSMDVYKIVDGKVVDKWSEPDE